MKTLLILTLVFVTNIAVYGATFFPAKIQFKNGKEQIGFASIPEDMSSNNLYYKTSLTEKQSKIKGKEIKTVIFTINDTLSLILDREIIFLPQKGNKTSHEQWVEVVTRGSISVYHWQIPKTEISGNIPYSEIDSYWGCKRTTEKAITMILWKVSETDSTSYTVDNSNAESYFSDAPEIAVKAQNSAIFVQAIKKHNQKN